MRLDAETDRGKELMIKGPTVKRGDDLLGVAAAGSHQQSEGPHQTART